MEGGQNYMPPDSNPPPPQQQYVQQYNEGASSQGNPGEQGGSLKRSADDGDYNGNNKRFKHQSNDQATIRILLQSKDAGGIIGKAGSNIKRLRSEYNAVVNVPDTNSSERILTITAMMPTALTILRECVPKIGEHSRGSNNPSHDIQLLVQRSQIGSIIGRAGYKIKEIRENSGANIKVFSDCLPNSTERVVAISGPLDTIVKCVEIIYQTLESTPIRGQVCLYYPSSQGGYDDWSYGGYGDDGRGPMGHGPRGGGRGGGRGGRGRGGGGGGRGGGGRRGGGGFNDGGGQGGGGGGGGYGGNSDFAQDIGGGFNDGNFGGMGQSHQEQSDQPTSSTQVTIPNDLAGSIIGKGGERIRNIRGRCGAVIKIDDPLPGADDRIITITGTQDQINFAQFLLQQSVRQYSGKKF
ncbi:heterogeneous nuclear ribonucleoprotein K [Exaiptasia diaphana]|uniref:K Homology domain-containing protein n=1 Tax=Exaiptasia diaphana TaxID=2652724 RepID=A0A913XIN7_EXADI|nr:heterogeneous nuclear ribonucleoprotein K [Exaiptasia diaphana]XP_020904929.1 heterogeneous nuclear ribonucleoprotein K [Exaiptasia diaphana]